MKDYREMGVSKEQFDKEMKEIATMIEQAGGDHDKTLLFLHFINDPEFRTTLKEEVFSRV